ncbi:hypothetical protein Tdes44962_MAKER05905, partial [Teratosphaeria destructans]
GAVAPRKNTFWSSHHRQSTAPSQISILFHLHNPPSSKMLRSIILTLTSLAALAATNAVEKRSVFEIVSKCQSPPSSQRHQITVTCADADDVQGCKLQQLIGTQPDACKSAILSNLGF